MCKCEKKCNCCLYSHCVCSGYGMLEERSSSSVSLFWSCSSRDVCLTSVFRKVHGQDVRSLLQYFGPWYVVFSCRSVGRGALIIKTFVRFLMAHTTHWNTHVHIWRRHRTHTHRREVTVNLSSAFSHPGLSLLQDPPGAVGKIGRASCRERV